MKKAREHCKKALNCTDDEIDEALLEMELKGLLVKDGNRNYELTSISERIMSMGLLSGQFKVNLVCFDCRKVILENMHGMMFIFFKTYSQTVSLLQRTACMGACKRIRLEMNFTIETKIQRLHASTGNNRIPQ